MPRGAAAQAGVESIRVGAVRVRFSTDVRRSSESGGLAFSGRKRGRSWCRGGASGAQRGAGGMLEIGRERRRENRGHMQFAGRIALLARDALLSRRRALSVDLSGEVVHRASVRHRHAATAPNNPIRRRRIEFNKPMQTDSYSCHAACLRNRRARSAYGRT